MEKVILIVIPLMFFGCHPDKNKGVDVNDLRFDTTDASELFFKNVRKSDYIHEELKDAGLDIYTHPDLDESMILQPSIIINWRTDKAFFHFETDQDTIEILLSDTVNTDTIEYSGANQTENARLAIQIYNAILKKRDIYFLIDNQKQLLIKKQHSDPFRIMVFDFLRLVELR